MRTLLLILAALSGCAATSSPPDVGDFAGDERVDLDALVTELQVLHDRIDELEAEDWTYTEWVPEPDSRQVEIPMPLPREVVATGCLEVDQNGYYKQCTPLSWYWIVRGEETGQLVVSYPDDKLTIHVGWRY
jgi:hypothetical protein